MRSGLLWMVGIPIPIKGSAQQAKGAIEETAGKITGDAKLRMEKPIKWREK